MILFALFLIEFEIKSIFDSQIKGNQLQFSESKDPIRKIELRRMKNDNYNDKHIRVHTNTQ